MDPASEDPVACHAWETGKAHALACRPGPPRSVEAWARIERIGDWLKAAMAAAASAEPSNSSAAEWLLDNGYQVQRAVLQIAEDLPSGFYCKLRTIATGRMQGDPRILTIAHDLLYATHFQISRESVLAYLEGYQQHDPLDIAEIWALPATLRIACLELLMAGFARAFPSVPEPILVSASCREYLGFYQPVECVARSIANLGIVSNIAWSDVFDAISHVERTLERDPAGSYTSMDFETRDAYRRSVERIAEHCGAGEVAVAESAILRAGESSELPHSHVGYWLIGAGRPEFARQLGAGRSLAGRLWAFLRENPGAAYFVALLLCGLVGLVLPYAYLAFNRASLWQWVLGLAFSVLPATVLSVTLVNWLVTSVVAPRRLPKLDFSRGIAPAWPTLVVMPVIIGDAGQVAGLLARLEAHCLANPEAKGFVMLSDPSDAALERRPGDEAIEAALQQGIDRLNRKYGAGDATAGFCLLHRNRRYNPAQGCWMAWERKRGKLEEFNHFLQTGDSRAFPLTAGPVDLLVGAKFVVTADVDTRLPPGCVARMAGALAHPLNRPIFDGLGRVVSGYTVMQPRVEIAPHGSDSLFARLFGGDTAIDIYSRAVSDVYQDLVGTGNFVGKGIYDVPGFARSLEGRIPENYLLSHDLWEGLHGRSALASDIIVYESFPSSYGEYVRRWHRWVRGDWQLLPWLLPKVPGPGQMRLRNRLTLFDRLRIWDNMRRSLVPVSVLLLMIGGWFLLPGSPLGWTILALLVPGAWLFTDLVTGLARGRRRGVMISTFRQTGEHLARWLLQIVFLPSDAATALHAIAVTMWRMGRRRHMLEWTSAADVERKMAKSTHRAGQWRIGSASTIFALGLFLAFMLDGHGFVAAVPLLCLWLIAPEIAVVTGTPRSHAMSQLDEQARIFLRRTARRSWLFFETFARPEDNWLPPDNHQMEPIQATAHRTSPTNIGMMALSMLCAWRLGHISTEELHTRSEAMFASLGRLERWHGHFLNWYDTTSLAPLEPRYVSTVDSGNLAVSMVVLARGCHLAADEPVFSTARWDGLEDCLGLLCEQLEQGGHDDRALLSFIAQIRLARTEPTRWPALVEQGLEQLAQLRAELVHSSKEVTLQSGERLRQLQIWMERSEHHLAACRRDLDAYLPWLRLLAHAPPEAEASARQIIEGLSPYARLNDIARLRNAAKMLEGMFAQQHESDPVRIWKAELGKVTRRALVRWRRLSRALKRSADRAAALAYEMDFGPLYDTRRKLFHIGYDISAQRIDPHYYDLLASEARLASYFAIAKQDVPPEHWFHLGRPIVKHPGALALVSWNGSMFEYLMPALFLRSDPETLLGESERSAVLSQRNYGARMEVPWGISESGFASAGADGILRYRAFGVPELGLRRGLNEDLVIAPYATALALAANPQAAVANLQRLKAFGAIGPFGFYEALDFTAARCPEAGKPAAVQSFMAHHQGMMIAAIGNALCNNLFVSLFHADPRVQTVDLLLNERIPWELPPELERLDRMVQTPPFGSEMARPQPWEIAVRPEQGRHILGNGRLSLRLGGSGDGDLRWNAMALTRPASVDQDVGHFFYFRDQESGAVWSAAKMPLGRGVHHTIYNAHKVEFRNEAEGIVTVLDVLLAPSEDVEIRRLRMVNTTGKARRIGLISDAEIALAPIAEWQRHPVFARLFVEAETHVEMNALLFALRPRSPGNPSPVLVQRLVMSDDRVSLRGWEVSRAKSRQRLANSRDCPYSSGEVGARGRFPLDPAAVFDMDIELPAHGETELAIVTTVASSREEALDLSRRYGSLGALDWAEQEAAARSARDLHTLGLRPDRLAEAQAMFAQLADNLAPRHAPSDLGYRDDLWALGISGDCPLLLAELDEDFAAEELRFVLAAQRFWRWRGFEVDLVLLHSGLSGYFEPLRDRIVEAVRQAGSDDLLGARSGVHILAREYIEARRLRTLQHAATLCLHSTGGAWKMPPREGEDELGPPFIPAGRKVEFQPLAQPEEIVALQFGNGLGGFTAGGDYRIDLDPMRATPAPWVNVIANADFGSIVTEAGPGFTFAGNSGENRLTQWHNDPLCDRQGEALYLRDEETGQVWSVTPLPAGRGGPCRVEHHLGQTQWHRQGMGLVQDLSCFVAADDPVKIFRLKLTDCTGIARRVTATCFADWLLGAIAGEPAMLRHSVYRPELRAILAVNHWHSDFSGRIAFLAANAPPHSLTTSRRAFLGAPADWQCPVGLQNWDLGNRSDDAGDDAIAALQLHMDIPANGVCEIAFMLGEGANEEQVADIIGRWQTVQQIDGGEARLAQTWGRHCAIEIETPDPAFDLMVNRWLPYQTMSSRLFGRAGYYQASGAFGFRDQLQDVLGLLWSDPDLARRQILQAAAHQFSQGDVLHWWHPPAGRGVRTRCSDDLLWLPHAVTQYVWATGDALLLDEEVPFLDAPELSRQEHDRFAQFPEGGKATVHEHCLRAFGRAWHLGDHGLPLIGDGDWNDGMNRVGSAGKGESVWLGWFMAATIRDFAELGSEGDRKDFAEIWHPRARMLTDAIDRFGWDGQWYIRAIDDQGRNWGAQSSDECRIDSLAQSWAVIAGGGDPLRARQALDSAFKELVRPEDDIVRLLHPPFDATARDPGYIKAYPPGIRENGGQYSHAAAWLGIAAAMLGDGARAKTVFDRINPIKHSSTPQTAQRYAIEPYVVAGDISGGEEHLGRGGWSWYTGAAAWSWRLASEFILGLRLEKGELRLVPCLPPDWPGFTATLRGQGIIEVTVERGGETGLSVDGEAYSGSTIPFPGQGARRKVVLVIAPA